jgi:EAL domain-containing protein (putative c-di-GMP-specific phosphodiesterase class I)
LSYLHRLPFDTLKIDRSFIKIVTENSDNSEILQTIISLAKNLKMRSIAEGIETETQLKVLRDLGCDFAQGYLSQSRFRKRKWKRCCIRNSTGSRKPFYRKNRKNLSQTKARNQKNGYLFTSRISSIFN